MYNTKKECKPKDSKSEIKRDVKKVQLYNFEGTEKLIIAENRLKISFILSR